jgi:carbamoyltransferase
MNILGISAFYHDSASCLISNGQIIAAAQEERFTRKKHDSNFPKNSIIYCLEEANISLNEIDYIVFYEKPFLKFERLIETYLAFAPKGFKSFALSMPLWVKEKLFQKTGLSDSLQDICKDFSNLEDKILFSEHHLSHAASAFYPSPFDEAAILTLDGVGEWTTTSLALGKGNKIEVLKEIHFPHSLGLLYSAFTYYTGFRVNSGEYKVMGLAPYGKPIYAEIIKENLIHICDDGSFNLNMDYFDFCTGLTMTNQKFHDLFGGAPRKSESEISQREMDLAASIQTIAEEVILKLAKDIKKTTNQNNLCLAGGVALNCVANGILSKSNIFENIWIQPAAGDAGGSLGAALAVWYLMLENKRNIEGKNQNMKGAYLGPQYKNEDIKSFLDSCEANYNFYEKDDLSKLVAQKLSQDKAVGWMQGRMEFGPRALGNRSIIADPRSPHIQKQLNLKVKYRESFRPFAPSILRAHLSEWFDLNIDSPYMLLVANILAERSYEMSDKEKGLFGIDKLNIPRSEVPAITHVDYSARIQTVHSETNPLYHLLIQDFYELTGCPILVNTSFNVRGEPIVCSPKDAFQCFMGTELDVLVIGNYLMLKDEQDQSLIKSYEHKYELD